MERPNMPERERTQRRTPKDIFDASAISQKGEPVDVTSLIPTTEGENESFSFQSRVQKTLDLVAETMNSPEYFQFEIEVRRLLEKVRGQYFIFDIEGTVMNDIQNLKDESESVYYAVPWIQPVIKELIENGNNVGFWTSATEESLGKIRKAMCPELAKLPAISREGWEKVALAYLSRNLGKMTDEDVIEVMQSVYPAASAESFKAGLDIFNENTLKNFNRDSTYFLAKNKYPQLFIPSENGFFIDDDEFSDSIKCGWPEHRAIQIKKSLKKDDVLEVVRAIKEGMKQ